MGIRSLHAQILHKEGQTFIEPVSNENEDSGCYLNGDPIIETTELKTLDRLTFGTNNMFVVVLPG